MKLQMPPLVDHAAPRRGKEPASGGNPGGDSDSAAFFDRFMQNQAQSMRTAVRGDWVQRAPNWKARARRWIVRACWRMVKRVLRRAWRHRVALAPFMLCALTYVTSAIAYLIDRGWVVVAASFITGGFVVYWWLGGKAWVVTRRRGLRPLSQRWWMAAGYATLAMLAVVTSAWRAGVPMPGFWAVESITFTIASAVFRYRARRKVIPDELLDPRQVTWDKIKKVKGAILGPPKDLGGGNPDEYENPKDAEGPRRWIAEVDLTDTDMLVTDVAKTAPHIAKRYRVGRSNVIVDELVAGEDALAQLTVTLENPLHQRIDFDESWLEMPEPGCFRFLSYSDGKWGLFRLYTPMSGTVNAFFSGDIGTGKSGAIFTAAIQACMSGRVHIIVGDPQQGQSLPALGIIARKQLGEEGYADDAERVYLQVLKLHAASLARSAYLKRYVWRDRHGDLNAGMEFFDQDLLASQKLNPETGEHPLFWPMVVYILEEAHLAAKDPEYGPEIVRLLADIVKLARKTGIAAWVANQNPGIEELGNNSALRQNLVAGNVLCYRNSSKYTGVMILDRSMPEPHTIPRLTPDGEQTQGMVVAACPARGSARNTVARSPFIERKTHWARRAAERVMPLDDVFLAAWAAADLERQEEQLAAEVTEYLKAKATGAVAAPAAAVEEGEPWRHGTVPERCVKYLQHLEASTGFGETTTGILAHECGAKLNTVSQALGRLARPKPTRKRPHPVPVVHSPRDGTWALGPAPAAALAGAVA